MTQVADEHGIEFSQQLAADSIKLKPKKVEDKKHNVEQSLEDRLRKLQST